MTVYIVRRILQTIPVLGLTSVFVFLLLRLVPGDPALILAGTDATPEVLQAVRADMGLDQPLPFQYLKWLEHVLRGDFGKSYVTKLPTLDLLILKLPATLELTVCAFVLALVIAVPTGILAAVRQRGPADLAISAYTAVGLAVPNFWVGILFILLFALALGWLPPGGRVEFGRDPALALKHLTLPALTLAVPQSAIFSRFLKGAVVEVLQEDFVRTARAKGVVERLVVFRHAIRNALIPVVTVLGMHFGRLLGGAVIIESVFAWPGVGRLMLQAIGDRDYTVVQGGLLLLVTTFVLINLLTDLSYGLLDPRIRLAQRRS
jgi:peptide/nickel transport system permease protein